MPGLQRHRIPSTPQIVIAGLTRNPSALPNCHCGPDPQSMPLITPSAVIGAWIPGRARDDKASPGRQGKPGTTCRGRMARRHTVISGLTQIPSTPQIVFAGRTRNPSALPNCHCGPDPQSMNPHGRLVLRGVVFEVLHNRFWTDGDRAGSLKVLRTELVRFA